MSKIKCSKCKNTKKDKFNLCISCNKQKCVYCIVMLEITLNANSQLNFEIFKSEELENYVFCKECCDKKNLCYKIENALFQLDFDD